MSARGRWLARIVEHWPQSADDAITEISFLISSYSSQTAGVQPAAAATVPAQTGVTARSIARTTASGVHG